MKKYLEMILQKTNEFINYKKTDKEEDDKSHILHTIDLALRKNSGVHVIFWIRILLEILSNMTVTANS